MTFVPLTFDHRSFISESKGIALDVMIFPTGSPNISHVQGREVTVTFDLRAPKSFLHIC